MLEKFCDARNTFEGKALAVFMAVVMVLSFSNLTSFAIAAEGDAPSDEPALLSEETPQVIDEPVVETEPVEPAVTEEPSATVTETPAVTETPSAPSSNEPAVDEPAPVEPAEPGVAVVGLDFEHAYITYLGQDIALPAETFNFPLNKELAFFVHADEGFEIDAVKTVIEGVEAELTADEQTGEYKVPADQVTSKLTVKVEAKAKESESPEPETDTPKADPITNDTKIEADSTDAATEAAAPEVAAAPSNSALRSVTTGSVPVTFVYTDENGQTVSTEQGMLPGGVIADNVPAKDGYSFKNAFVDNNPIVFAGEMGGSVFYTAEGDLDSGVAMRLEDGKSIQLVYGPYVQKYQITYSESGASGIAGNSVDGPASLNAGEQLNFRVDVAYGYHANVSCNGAPVSSNGYLYQVDGIDGDAVINVEYVQNDSLAFSVADRGLQNFHSASFSPNQTFPVPSDGVTFTVNMTSAPSMVYEYDWRLDALSINGETLNVPTAFSVGARAETTLSTGVRVGIELKSISGWDDSSRQFSYDIVVQGAKDDIVITSGNFRASTWQEVIPRYTSGVVLEKSPIDGGGFESVANYLPVQTNYFPIFRVKLEAGYENLQILLNGEKPSLKERDGWLYCMVPPLGSGNPLQTLDISASLIQYQVKYDANGGTNAPTDSATYDFVSNKQLMVAGAMPSKDGEVFLGWKLQGGNDTYYPGSVLNIEEVAAHASEGNELVFVAQWAKKVEPGTPIPVQVHYYYQKADGTFSSTPDRLSSVSGFANTEIVKWNGAEEAPEGYLYNENLSVASALVSADASNPTVLKLYYDIARDVSYTVHYYLEGTTTPVADDKVVENQTFGTEIQESAADIRGYQVVGESTQSITLDAYGKELTFYYVSAAADYTVRHWFQNIDNDEYSQDLPLLPDQTVEGIAGELTAAVATAPEGFTAQAVEQKTIAADGSTVVNVYYERNSYEVTYAFDRTPEGASEVPAPSYHKYGAAVDVAPGATAPGYTFAGWTTSDAAVEDGSFTMPAGNVAFTGTWTANQATVEVWFYDLNGTAYVLTEAGALSTAGAESAHAKTITSDSKSGYSEDELKQLAATAYDLTPEKDKYADYGMEVSDGAGGWEPLASLDSHVIQGGETIRYHVSPEGARTVTYRAGDQGEGADFVDGSYFKGDTVAQKSLADTGIVAKPGYSFAGWTTEDVAVEADGSFAMPGRSVVFTAQWAPNDGTAYTVEHYKVSADGSTATLVGQPLQLAATTGTTVQAEALSIPGYTYQPNFNENGMTTVASGTVAGNGSLVLKLYYTPDADALVYDANHGTGAMTPTAGVTDGDVSVAENGFTRTDFKFTGWNTKADGAGVPYAPGATYRLTAEDDVLYAQWTEQATLTYDLNGGRGIKPADQQVDKGTTITEFAAGDGLSNGGATFKGWSADPNSLEPLTELTMDESKTVYAIWVDVYEAIYLAQQYADPDNPSTVEFIRVHPEGVPSKFEVKAGDNFLGDKNDTTQRLDWMPESITTTEKGIDGASQSTTQNFYYWDRTNSEAAEKRVSVYYTTTVESGSLSDGDVSVNNASRENYSAIRQGMVTVRTHYLDAAGNVEHAQLTGNAITRYQGTSRSVTEQLYFAWQAENFVSLAVQNSSADWVLNKVVRSDGGDAVAGGSGATLSNVAGNSTVDIYLTPKYTVSYFDVTGGTEQALPELAQVGTVPVANVDGGTSLLPAGMGLISDLSAQALPTPEGYTYEASWNTAAAFDGTAVTPGDGLDLALFGEGRALSLYAKGTLNSYEVAYQWNADQAPADAVLPTGGTFDHGDAFTVDTEYTADTRVELTDEFGNVTDVYTFSGWDTGDFTVTGSRTITGTWTHTENTIPQARVTYEWDGPVPAGETLPVNDTYYTLNQDYRADIDTAYTSETVIETHDAYNNVNGRYTFSGWTDENTSGTMVEGGVVIKGTWTFESVVVAQHKVTYEWTGDVPEGDYAQTLPQPITGLVNGQDYNVDAQFTSETSIPHLDQYGNVDGHYTFGGWSQTGTQTMGDADVTITGTWTLVPQDVPAYGVTYEWTNAPDGDYEQTLPTDPNTYVKGQGYPVDATFVAGDTVDHLDQYGNVDGTWTFLGWHDAHAGVMVEGGATIEGAWSYASQDVDAHNVSYEWTGAPTGQNAPVLPIDANAYVPGQTYPVDTTFTNASTINDLDAYGNVKGVWTFGGWNDPNAGTMGDGDVVITGEWIYAATPVQKHGVAYDWGTENIPAGVTLPQDFDQYVPGQTYPVDAEYAAGTRIDAFDAYHNLNGYYTFSGWNDPGVGVMGTSDVTITGSWSFTPVEVPAYGVTYDWGDVAVEVAAVYQLPVDSGTYVRGQNYPLDATEYQPVNTYDAYGNVNGTWTFGGWNDAHGGVMVEGGVTVTGSWTYAPVDVAKRTVSYDWGTQDVPADAQLPASVSGLVKGQGYEVDGTYTNETVIETHDEFGNVNGRYTFSGWNDPAGGTVGDTDVVITGSWSYSDVAVPAHGVAYVWVNAPDGEYEQTLPVDGAQYVKGQGYAVDATYAAGYTVDHKDAYGNVDGTWTFEGWTDPNNGIMGEADVTVSGSWSYEAAEVAKHQVNYEWTGDVPGGAYAPTLPAAIRDLVKNQPYDIDTAYAPGMTVDHLDQYGNVDGTWTFQGWSDPNAGTMGEADVTVTGAWAYEEIAVPTHQVKYDWGQAAPEILAAYSLPAGVEGLVKGQPYTVDPTVYQPVNTVDQYGNVTGTYTFNGWIDPNNGTMGDADVTITGTWTYQSEDVQTYGVRYEWTGAPTGAYVQSLPTNPNAYVKGEGYPVDTTFAQGTTVESTDAYGNVNGRWTFSGWNDPGAGVMLEGGVTLTGSWAYESVAVAQHQVSYEWTGDVPAGAELPAAVDGLVKGQTYTVDAKFTSETSVPHYDQYGNVDGIYTFSGWSQTGQQAMGDADVVITGAWTLVPQDVPAYGVTYVWTNAPDGDYERALPTDSATYVKGQGYTVDTTFVAGETKVDHLDQYGNVDGTWTFQGWNDPHEGTMAEGGVTVSGSWTYESVDVVKRNVNYVWTGDVPDGAYEQALPAAISNLVKGQSYQIDTAYAPGMTVDHLDQYGNVDGIWTFQGWTDPNNGTMGDVDVTVAGAWSYAQVDVAKHAVGYDWGTRNVPAGVQLPSGIEGLVKGQTYTVDNAFAAGMTVDHTDAFGNVDGRYIFSGWSQTGQQTMGDADVTITGAWSYEPVAVAQHQVSYEWTGTVPAGAQLPASLGGLVKGQPYAADAAYYNGYQVTDATGVYTFSGWTDPNAGVMGDADVVLTGGWTYEAAEYTVVYNWTNPPATAVIPVGGTFAYGDAFTVDTQFAAGTQVSDATGTWTFGGWSTGDFTVEGNVTITGDWTFEAAEYVVRFVDYNDTELGTGTYGYGDAVNAPADPTRADEDGLRYTFAGWRAEDGTVYAGTAVPTVTGNAVYTAVYTSAAVPATPVTPPTPTTPPATPTPATPTTPTTPTPPGVIPEATPPVVADVINALEDAVTPLAGPEAAPEEQVIDDNGNPLAGYDRVNCWVHWYLILGIIVTLVYGAAVLVRRMNFTHKLKGFENDVLGIEDETADAAAPAAPFATEGKEA